MTLHRRPRALALALAAAACTSADLEESLPRLEEIPPSAAVVYRIEPELIDYHFSDVTAGTNLQLRWVSLPEQPYQGYNCIALSPRTPTDTVGTFVFVARGPNQGLVERTTPEVTDTIAGYFIANGQGSRGSFILNSSGQLSLFWSNGSPSRYFDPAGLVRISGDSVIADAAISQAADSIQATWHVVWRINAC